jgi:hypothetical protein
MKAHSIDHKMTSTMKIIIEETKSLGQIQNEFNHSFPFLRLEFLPKNHKSGSGSGSKAGKDRNSILKDYRKLKSGQIEMDDDMTVGELEKQFNNLYGLNAQVFRRSGKLWLETTATDNWTLSYQNEQGKELSTGPLKNEGEEYDYHEQD